jgi:hypothetical protein
MPSRNFRDPDGTVWEAWDVFPGQHSSDAHDASRHLPEGMAQGWLCFQSDSEKRRLTPVPEAWHEGDESALRRYLQLAGPVPARRPQLG